jgi:hypothetical protein
VNVSLVLVVGYKEPYDFGQGQIMEIHPPAPKAHILS